MKAEDEHGGLHVKGESTESELDEEDEDEDVIQLREGSEEERGNYTQVRSSPVYVKKVCVLSTPELNVKK